MLNIKKIDPAMRNLFLLWFAVIAFFTYMKGGEFLSEQTFQSIAFVMPELGLLTLAMFAPLLSGGFNLAIIVIANVTSLFGIAVFHIFQVSDMSIGMQGLMIAVVFIASLLIAMVCGLIIGFMVSYVGAHPILVTLGMMTLLKGVGIIATSGRAVSGVPEVLTFFGNSTIWAIPVPLFIFVGIAILLHLFMTRTTYGRYIYLIGSNINAVYYSGINTKRVVMFIYILSSALATVAGYLMMARFNSSRVGYGDAYLLLTVLIAILGGTDPNGGFGKVSTIAVALLVLQTISTGLNIMGTSQYLSMAMWGLVLLGAMSFKYVKDHYKKKMYVKKAALATNKEN